MQLGKEGGGWEKGKLKISKEIPTVNSQIQAIS